MNIKLNVLTAAVLAGFSTAALSAPVPVPPPAVPSMYLNGPATLQFQDLSLSDAERAGYALLESVMQVAEATILAKASCSAAAGTYPIVGLFANGDAYDPAGNTVTVLSNAGSFTLEADLDPIDSFRGQTMTINQDGTGKLAGTGVKEYTNEISFNAAGTMMTGWGSVKAKGVNNVYDLFQVKVIKDFYRDNVQLDTAQDLRAQVPVIYDWGLQSVSKLGYPVNKYWQRSKSLRDDGIAGSTHFVKDRLVGSSACRIQVKTTGSNNADFFQQSGSLIISTDLPSVNPGF